MIPPEMMKRSLEEGPGESPGFGFLGNLSENSSLRLLIVDDSHVIRQRLLALLNPLPFIEIVGQAPDLAAGREGVESLNPDVVTLDLNLKGESGLDLLAEIQGYPSPPKVIVLTNYPYPVFRARSKYLGAAHFLTKTQDFQKIPGILEGIHRDVSGRQRDPG